MIIKIKPDKKRVESILDMTESRRKSIPFLDFDKFSTIVAEMYYEIIKELSSALVLLDGFKFVGENAHKDLINFLSKYDIFSEEEMKFIHDLRIKRNKSSYEGKFIDAFYLQNKKGKIEEIIKKLKNLIKKRLEI